MRLQEYYFDQPITVEDSFYIAITLQPDSLYPDGVDNSHYIAFRPCIFCLSQFNLNMGHDCPNMSSNFSALKYRMRLLSANIGPYNPGDPFHETWTSLGWRDTAVRSCLMIFPIIKYGSASANCTPVEGLHTTKQEGATFYFEWNDTTLSHRGWEFTYVPDESSPDGGTIVACNEANASATVEPGTQYRAYVRPRCVGNRHGDWDTGIPFCYNCQPEAINTADASVSIHPNPTSSVVEVTSPYTIQQIEVFDARETLVLTTRLSSSANTAQIDLSPYADSTYMLKIHTSAGMATKPVMRTRP